MAGALCSSVKRVLRFVRFQKTPKTIPSQTQDPSPNQITVLVLVLVPVNIPAAAGLFSFFYDVVVDLRLKHLVFCFLFILILFSAFLLGGHGWVSLGLGLYLLVSQSNQ